MSACTFFGHRSVTQKIEPTLRSTLIKLIEENVVDLFYIGNNGGFDMTVRKVLRDLTKIYPISYFVVLAYLPKENRSPDLSDFSDTIIPDGIEKVPRRFAIDYRNKWMISRSDHVVTYVRNDVASCAAKYKRLAVRKGIKNIELCDLMGTTSF